MLINLNSVQFKRCFAALATLIAFIGLYQTIGFEIIPHGLHSLTQLQSDLNQAITLKLKALRNNYSKELFQTLLGYSFLYGVFHAIGPGHGKSIISSWVAIQRRQLKEIAFVAAGAAFLHAFSAVSIVAAIVYIAGKYLPGMLGSITIWLNIISGMLLVGAGLGILKQASEPSQQSCSRPQPPFNIIPSIHPAWIALSIGIVPCPLAAVMFIYCLSSDMMEQGLLLITAFALGMGATLFSTAAAVFIIKSKTARWINNNRPGHCYHLFNLLSALLFIIVGVLIAVPGIQSLR